MWITLRKILTVSVLATYGVAGLLGQGLHWLSTADHHHHGPVAHCHAHGDAHHHHHGSHHHHHAGGHGHHHGLACGDAAEQACGPILRGGDGFASCQDCEICAFLMQIRSERPQIVAPTFCCRVVGDIPATTERAYTPIAIGIPSPRGPPILAA